MRRAVDPPRKKAAATSSGHGNLPYGRLGQCDQYGDLLRRLFGRRDCLGRGLDYIVSVVIAFSAATAQHDAFMDRFMDRLTAEPPIALVLHTPDVTYEALLDQIMRHLSFKGSVRETIAMYLPQDSQSLSIAATDPYAACWLVDSDPSVTKTNSTILPRFVLATTCTLPMRARRGMPMRAGCPCPTCALEGDHLRTRATTRASGPVAAQQSDGGFCTRRGDYSNDCLSLLLG
jgi:hypothetical protein